MKKFYFFFLALIIMNGAMAQWIPQNSGTTKNLRSVHFTDANTGYAVGDSGTILKTINGGSNWEIQSSGITYDLHSVYFPSVSIGYAVGGASIGGVGGFGVILKTIDGGATWTMVYSSDTIIANSCAFNGVFFTDTNTGYAVGGYSNNVEEDTPLIRKTTDGGITWTMQSPGMACILNSVYFTDSNIGYTVGNYWSSIGRIFKTINGGSSWASQDIDDTYSVYSVYFINSDTGYAAGYAAGYEQGWWDQGLIIKTTNGGSDWTHSFTSINDVAQFNSICFTDTSGYAVGNPGNIHQLFGGDSLWYFTTPEITVDLYSIYFPSTDIGYAVGDNGAIYKTINGGVGIIDHNQTEDLLKVHPNPTSTNINIATAVKGNLSILNLNGQQLLQQEITGLLTTIDIGKLAKGIYILKVVGVNGVQLGKIIKQ